MHCFWLRVHLVLDNLFRQTLFDSYFNEMISGSFGNVPVNKTRHYFLAILLGFLWYYCVTNKWIKADTMCYLIHWLGQGWLLVLLQWFNQTLWVSYFTELVSGSLSIGPVNKIRHYVLAILLVQLRYYVVTDH